MKRDVFWCNECNKKTKITYKQIYKNRTVRITTECDCGYKCDTCISFGKPIMLKHNPCFGCDNFDLCGQTKGIHKCKRFINEKSSKRWSSDHSAMIDRLHNIRKQRYEAYLKNKEMEDIYEEK